MFLYVCRPMLDNNVYYLCSDKMGKMRRHNMDIGNFRCKCPIMEYYE